MSHYPCAEIPGSKPLREELPTLPILAAPALYFAPGAPGSAGVTEACAENRARSSASILA